MSPFSSSNAWLFVCAVAIRGGLLGGRVHPAVLIETVTAYGAVLQVDVVQCVGERLQRRFPFAGPQLAFPDDDDVPAHLRQLVILLPVALTVTADFLLPELRVRPGHAEVAAALVPVPEAAVDEHARAVLPQHDVGMPWQPGVVQAVPEALPPQVSPHRHFGLRVPRPYRSHVPVPLLCRQMIHQGKDTIIGTSTSTTKEDFPTFKGYSIY